MLSYVVVVAPHALECKWNLYVFFISFPYCIDIAQLSIDIVSYGVQWAHSMDEFRCHRLLRRYHLMVFDSKYVSYVPLPLFVVIEIIYGCA